MPHVKDLIAETLGPRVVSIPCVGILTRFMDNFVWDDMYQILGEEVERAISENYLQ